MLRRAADKEAHRIVDLVQELAQEFRLTEADREEQLSSGQQVIYNRMHWAATYLVKAGLLERPARGNVRITERGLEVLQQPPSRINIAFLSQFPEFEGFRTRAAGIKPPVADHEAEKDPEELLDSTYAMLRRTVEADLLDHVLGSTPAFFEQLVLDLLVAMGYGGARASEAARHVGRTGDDGIDGVIDEDKLGLDAIYIQAKRWAPDHPVRRPDLQAFTGSLEGQRASKGVFITTSRFTEDAKGYVQRIGRRVVLIDGQMLGRLMYDHQIGVREHRTYQVRRVDGAYFEGEA